MRPPIDGGVVLVTGASSGIGLEMARALAPRVRALVLVARRTDRLNELARELVAARPDLKVHALPCDLGDRAATDALLAEVEAHVGAVDVLINNAGMGDFGMFDLSDWRKQEQILTLNIVALAYLTHRLMRPMMARGRGGVLNVSSGFGMEFMPGFATYVGSKHFVTGFTECLRIEARKKGVVVSQLCPGPVETEFEQVATGIAEPMVPRWVQLSAARCARWAIRAFSRGRAMIVPGFLMKFVFALGAWSPRWIKRLIYRPMAARTRRLQERALAALPAPGSPTK